MTIRTPRAMMNMPARQIKSGVTGPMSDLNPLNGGVTLFPRVSLAQAHFKPTIGLPESRKGGGESQACSTDPGAPGSKFPLQRQPRSALALAAETGTRLRLVSVGH